MQSSLFQEATNQLLTNQLTALIKQSQSLVSTTGEKEWMSRHLISNMCRNVDHSAHEYEPIAHALIYKIATLGAVAQMASASDFGKVVCWIKT